MLLQLPMSSKCKTYKILNRALALVLYLAFFTVQLFFNFDLHSTANKKLTSSVDYSSFKIKKGSFFITKSNVLSKSNNRLNKRFEPKSIGECVPLFVSFSYCYYGTETFGYYYRINFLSDFPYSNGKRGPPAFA